MIACILGVRKKPENRLNRENRKKKLKKPNRKKKPIKPIKFLKKPAGSVRFQFYKQKTEPNPTKNRKKNRAKPEKPSQTEKTNQNRKKPSQNRETEPNRFEPVFALKNRTEPKPVGLTRFRFFFQKKKFRFGYFFDKNRTEPKIISPNAFVSK
jgi:hypothetical protein